MAVTLFSTRRTVWTTNRPATAGSSWRANCGWCRGDLGDLDPVVAGHLIPLVGRRDERLAELPHVGRGAQRDALVAALGDIYVPGNLTFRPRQWMCANCLRRSRWQYCWSWRGRDR